MARRAALQGKYPYWDAERHTMPRPSPEEAARHLSFLKARFILLTYWRHRMRS